LCQWEHPCAPSCVQLHASYLCAAPSVGHDRHDRVRGQVFLAAEAGVAEAVVVEAVDEPAGPAGQAAEAVPEIVVGAAPETVEEVVPGTVVAGLETAEVDLEIVEAGLETAGVDLETVEVDLGTVVEEGEEEADPDLGSAGDSHQGDCVAGL